MRDGQETMAATRTYEETHANPSEINGDNCVEESYERNFFFYFHHHCCRIH